MKYAAIEILRGETPHGTIYRFMQAAVARKAPFAQLEVMDVFTLGPHRFVRFRTDLGALDTATQEIRQKRAVVIPDGVSYKLYRPGNPEVQIPSIKMHMAALPAYKRLYRGPNSDLWEAQFTS
jgi:hypothetical protein